MPWRTSRPRWPRGGVALHPRRPALGRCSPTRRTDGAVTVSSEAPDGVDLLSLVMADERVGSAWSGGRPRGGDRLGGTERGPVRRGIPAEAELASRCSCASPAPVPGRGNGHTVIEAGRHSRATVVLQHSGSAQHNANVEIRVGDGADLTVVTVQEWDDDAIHLAQHDALIGRDAHLQHIVVTLGGEIVRVSTNARYCGPGGSFEGLGVYFADAGQHQEHRLFVDHEAPHCTVERRVQGRPAGPERAHRLGGRRPHPRQRRGHRHLRDSTATSSSRTGRAPTRCRTSRSRPARSSAPATPRRPAASTTSSCSTCSRAASTRTSPAVWWCAGSSPASCSASACPRCRST